VVRGGVKYKEMKDGAQVILFKDSRRKEVFLIRRTDVPLWVETGGGMEVGETPIEAAIRETKEESNFNIKLGKLVVIYDLFDKSKKLARKEYIFEGIFVSGKYKPEFQGNIGKWFCVDDLPDISKATKRRITDVICNLNSSKTIRIISRRETLWDYKFLIVKHPIFVFRFLMKKIFD